MYHEAKAVSIQNQMAGGKTHAIDICQLQLPCGTICPRKHAMLLMILGNLFHIATVK